MTEHDCPAVHEARAARAALHDAVGLVMDVETAVTREGVAPPLPVERTIEVALGLASPHDDCDLCQRHGLACPPHAAAEVAMALFRDGHLRFAYVPPAECSVTIPAGGRR